MSAPLFLWAVRILVVALPFTLLEALLAATTGAPDPVRITIQVVFWCCWAAAVAVSLLPLPSTLTALRLLVPIAPVAGLVAALVEAPPTAGWVGLALAVVATVLAFSAMVGDWFVDGASYGDERRFALRPPVVLLLGPLPLAWVLTVGPLISGVLLFADENWYLGVPLVLFGIATAWWGSFAMWRLARRWLVFVPAGITLVDDMALAEPVLFTRPVIRRMGPAHVGTEATDLTVGALGLVVELDLAETVELTPAAGRGQVAESISTSAVLVVPSRPAAVLDHAQRCEVPVVRN